MICGEESIEAKIERDFQSDGHRLYIRRLANGVASYAQVTFHALEAGKVIPPSADMRAETTLLVQAIVDAAWREGFRPAGYVDLSVESIAGNKHLEDMRTIAFHKMGVPKP